MWGRYQTPRLAFASSKDQPARPTCERPRFVFLLLLVLEQRACHLRIDRVVIPFPSCAVNLAAEHSRRYSAEKCVELSDTLGALKRRPFYWMGYVVSNIEATTQPVSRL